MPSQGKSWEPKQISIWREARVGIVIDLGFEVFEDSGPKPERRRIYPGA